jgi:uncharacterized OB-fold protein
MRWNVFVGAKCSRCGRLYETQPKICICAHLPEDVLHGHLKAITENTAVCMLCNSAHDISDRVYRCECIPKHISKIRVSNSIVLYKCETCGITKLSTLPVEWCCNAESKLLQGPSESINIGKAF